MSPERRQHTRVPLRMLVQFRVNDMQEFLREHAANISAGGMFVRTREPHPPGANVYFQFSIDDGAKVFSGLGRVVHVNPPSHAIPGMGIEFVNLDEQSKRVIDDILAARARELDEAGEP